MSILNEKRAEELLAPTTKMIQVPSYSGQENLVVDVMKKFCDERRFIDIYVDRYDNCVCRIKGSKLGLKVLLNGHIDTVPVPDEMKWDHDPSGAEVVDGRIYGHGISDMKGALSAVLAAALYYAEGTDHDLPGDVYVADVVHEECFEGVAARKVSAYMKPDYVIVGEASQLNMKIDQKDRAKIVMETFGVPAHPASPHKDVNTVYKMCKVIEEINKLTPPHHDVLGDGILELMDVKSSPYPGASVVPGYCHATYNRRLPTGEAKESVLAPLQEPLNGMMKENSQLKAKASHVIGQEKHWADETVETERFFPGWFFDKNEDWVQNIYKGMKEIGLSPTITNYDFCTNASHHAGEVGVRPVGVGPSLETLIHTINEYIEIDQLNKVMEFYYGVMKALSEQDY